MSDTVTRVGLLLCGHVDPRSQHLRGDYFELFTTLLLGHPIELVRYDVQAGKLPHSALECDGWICSPSRASVYDDLPWLSAMEELHRDIVSSEVPYVGICFGHQLLAQTLGGTVARASGGWNVGVHEYIVEAALPCIAPRVDRLALIASHQDQVVEPPPGARVFARAEDGSCPVGGMVVGERAWTIQLHPEFLPDLADHLLAGRIDLIGAEKVARARATLTPAALGARPLSRPTVASWIATTLCIRR